MSELKYYLTQAVINDTEYEVRYIWVLKALSEAASKGFDTGIKIDPELPEWPVVYIELPTGQISWHMPQFSGDWDKHTTPEKFKRIREFVNAT